VAPFVISATLPLKRLRALIFMPDLLMSLDFLREPMTQTATAVNAGIRNGRTDAKAELQIAST
jgi:hypothetical protein